MERINPDMDNLDIFTMRNARAGSRGCLPPSLRRSASRLRDWPPLEWVPGKGLSSLALPRVAAIPSHTYVSKRSILDRHHIEELTSCKIRYTSQYSVRRYLRTRVMHVVLPLAPSNPYHGPVISPSCDSLLLDV